MQRKDKAGGKKILHQSIVLLIFLFFAGIAAPLVYAWVITVSPISYTPVVIGGYTTISWSAPTSDYCWISGPTITESTGGVVCGHGVCQVQVMGQSGSYYTGPINGNYDYTIGCSNVSGGVGSSQGSGIGYITVVPGAADNCAANPTGVTGGLQVPPGTYHVVAQGSNFCITNNSGKSVFVPTASATEVNNFKAATQGYLAGTIAYFARAAGY